MTKNTTTKIAVTEVTSELVAGQDNTSKKIRYLNSLGYTNGEIEKIFQNIGVTTKTGSPIRYQHIRNVLITPINQK